MAVEIIDRDRWWGFSYTDKNEWERRLLEQLKVTPYDIAEFWIDGDKVIGARQWLRGEDGHRTGAWKILGEEAK